MNSLKSLAKRILPHRVNQIIRRTLQGWRKVRNRVVYAGDNIQCPLCENEFGRFASTGVLDREFWQTDEGKQLLKKDFIAVAQKKCPNCGSSERQRLQYFFLRDRLQILSGPTISILDVAPDGFMQEKLYSSSNIDYTSIDINEKRKPTFLMDLTNLSFEEGKFDAIVCYHVLEHIRNDRKAMCELLRVLKPGGWALLQVPIWAEQTIEDPTVPETEYLKHYGHQGHVRRYGMNYVDSLREVGFEVTLDYFAKELPLKDRERFGIDPAEIIFFCHRPMSGA